MKNFISYSYVIIFLSIISPLKVLSLPPSEDTLKALYESLNPNSLREHLAFYKLYPDRSYGQKALDHSQILLSSTNKIAKQPLLSESLFNRMVDLVIKGDLSDENLLDIENIELIEEIASHLKNRQLKGYNVNSEKESLRLPSKEIDLARSLLISQLSDEKDYLLFVRSYEATLDLFALQILAQIGSNSSDLEKINALNQFIFHDMHFCFPPKSEYSDIIDHYTFLPSVLDSKKGVCLGVSIVYLCLAQRIGLDLKALTPPGHIYLCYNKNEALINIETTARGVHIQTENYLDINTIFIEEHPIKEIIGLAHFNQASVMLCKTKDYQKAIEAYKKAEKYLPNYSLLHELLGYAYYLNGDQKKGKKLLKKALKKPLSFLIYQETLKEDILLENADSECLEVLLSSSDEERANIEKRRDNLLKLTKKNPLFRSGIFHLAVTWLELSRPKEAIEELEKYHKLEPNNPTVEYLLASLYFQRLDYNKSLKHLKNAENLVPNQNFKGLKNLRNALGERIPLSN